MKVGELYIRAQEMEKAEHEEKEKGKIGVLRAGNSGIYLPEKGQVVGKCQRLTHLRTLGVEIEEIPNNRRIMFEGGFSNEKVWFEKLKKTWEGPILCEEEIPISWRTNGGTLVTGRPDIVLCTEDPAIAENPPHIKPVLGLELKCVSSLWTARDVLFNQRPKFDHLAQAAHYMWQLSIPFRLCYTSYVDYAIPAWAVKNRLFPSPGEGFDEYLDFNDNGNAKKTLPFNMVYELQFLRAEDMTYHLHYRPEGSEGEWKNTPITVEGIRQYYHYVEHLGERKDLGKRPLNLRPDGTKENWGKCDYCNLTPICDRYEENYNNWIKAVRKLNLK